MQRESRSDGQFRPRASVTVAGRDVSDDWMTRGRTSYTFDNVCDSFALEVAERAADHLDEGENLHWVPRAKNTVARVKTFASSRRFQYAPPLREFLSPRR